VKNGLSVNIKENRGDNMGQSRTKVRALEKRKLGRTKGKEAC